LTVTYISIPLTIQRSSTWNTGLPAMVAIGPAT